MDKLSFSKKEGIRAAVYSLFFLLLFLIVPWFSGRPLAQGVYSSAEQIYLKNITPLLYEFSQAASEVSASLLKLQSAPPEECSSRFADYRGIVGSLGNQLGSLTPPPRLETVHEYAMQALNGYSSGLELYFKACTEEDFGVKESLVSQGGIFLNKSVGSVGKAYDEMENLKAAGPAVVKKEANEEITEGDITDAGLAEDASPDESGLQGEPVKTADSGPPAEGVKTKAEVLEEISRKVQADMEAEDSEAPVEENAVSEAPAAPEPKEEVYVPETPREKPEVKTVEKTDIPEAPAAEPPAPPSETPEVKTEEAPSGEVSAIEKDNAEAPADVKTEEETKEPEEESDEEKIERLNQKIMEQTKTAQPAEDTVEASTGDTKAETPPAQVPDKGKAAEESPGSPAADTPKAGDAAPDADNQEVAAMPPGEAAEELKEEEAPVDDVKSWCQDRFHTTEEQENCMKSRAVAKDKIDKLTSSFSGGTREREVLDKCMSDWKEGGTYNYEMAIYCTQFFCTQNGIEGCKDLSK